MTLEESNKYCEPICRDFRGWDLPIMIGLGGKHGVVESRHQVFNDVEEFPFEDGHDGQWPVSPSTRYHPGGINASEDGVIDYWEDGLRLHVDSWRNSELKKGDDGNEDKKAERSVSAV
ncbi:MAG: hypothetical protein Q9215_008229 [Flavoplaca cf. flavocitrina]